MGMGHVEHGLGKEKLEALHSHNQGSCVFQIPLLYEFYDGLKSIA
jgi:hypothetical protein